MNSMVCKSQINMKVGDTVIGHYLSGLHHQVYSMPFPLQKITYYLIDGVTNHEHTILNLQKRLGWRFNPLWNQFKQYTGFTPKGFITYHRIELAKQLLSETDLRMGDIATLLGYEQPHALTMRFQKVMGMSLIAYREKQKIK